MKKYVITQGLNNFLENVAEFSNKKDAIKKFNGIKKDTYSWCKGTLTTQVLLEKDNDENCEIIADYSIEIR